MPRFHFANIRLRFSISTAFLLLMVPSILGIVWFVYARNSAAVTDLAGKSMQQASASAIEHTIDHLDSVSSLVSTVAAFGTRDPSALAKPGMSGTLLQVLLAYPQIDSLYVGFKDTGNFTEAVRLPPRQQTYGPNNIPVPPGAVYVVRYLDRARGRTPTDRYTYLSGEGRLLFEESSRKVTYDPRVRPFYRNAVDRPASPALTNVYLFASTGKAGITISRAIPDHSGNIIGAAGADFTIENIANFLRSLAPSAHGLTLIVDDDRKIVAHPTRTDLAGAEIAAAADSLLTSALQDHVHSRLGLHTTFNARGADYIASFTPFPPGLGKPWELLSVAPTDDFVGALKRTTRNVLLFGLAVLFVGIIGIRLLSMSLTRPIERLIVETERIRRLELDAEIRLPRAAVKEIVQLTQAMRTMKATLQSFGQFVPKTLVRDLLATGRKLQLGGESRVVTILFSDLANFSSLAESVPAADLAARTSDYLEDVTQEVIRHRGIVDKYIGDAVMPLWNAPVPDEDHITCACSAALCAQRRLELSNQRWADRGWKPISMRIGIHTNDVVVGIIGSTEHMSYTALGDGVNIASRLEGVNKVYGTQICVSHIVYLAARDRFLFRPMDCVAVKGRKEPIVVYELMAALAMADTEAGPTPDQFEKARLTEEAFAAWRKNDLPRAHVLYTSLCDRFPSDLLARYHLRRCDETFRAIAAA